MAEVMLPTLTTWDDEVDVCHNQHFMITDVSATGW
jgi:hypothetical protein